MTWRPRSIATYSVLLVLAASQAPMHKQPQTRDQMCATLLRGMQETVARMNGSAAPPASAQDIESCRNLVDAYLLQSKHPLWLKYGYSLDVMSQEQVDALHAELAGTPYEGVRATDKPYCDIAFFLGHDSGEWFPHVEQPTPGTLLGNLLGGLLAALATLGFVAGSRTQQPARKDRVGAVLDFFAMLCGGESGENIRAAAGDLRKDVRAMRAKACPRWQVATVRFCRTTTTIVPIAWDGLARAIRAVVSVVRRIDPPRLG